MPTLAKITKYRQLIQDLLPRGHLWEVLSQPKLKALLESMAVELARVDDRGQDALLEVDPRTTTELISDWERLVGLPDECTPIGATLEERRQLVLRKYTSVGGLSAAYYEFLTEQLGYPSVVTDWRQFQVGRSRVGERLTNDFEEPFVVGMTVGQSLFNVGWLFFFNVEMPATAIEVFEVGDTVGLPLRDFSNPLIECTIKKLKPAHAGVTFTFSGV